MWPGTKARLKARANMIKACPYQLMWPAEMDWRRQGPTQPLLHHHHHHHGLQRLTLHHLQTLSGLCLGFNPEVKAWNYCIFPGVWEWRLFSHQHPQARFLTLLFSENVTFVDRGQPLFLRGFVISCHSAKCCKSHHRNSLSCRKTSWVLTDACVSTHSLYNVHCVCMKDLIPEYLISTLLIILSSNFSSYLHKFKDDSWHQYKHIISLTLTLYFGTKSSCLVFKLFSFKCSSFLI